MSAERDDQDQYENEEFEALLEHLHRSRGFDFTGYKRASLERRVQKRMEEVGVSSFRDYQDHLEVNPDEFTELFNTILINVTGFFRDRPAWDYLRDEVIPELLETVPRGDPIRVWSAACASGEEAYTVAMLLSEALGEKAFRRRVKIYATDVDEDALATARHATFPVKAMKSVPDELVERYFVRGPVGYSFLPELRRSVIFGRNDMVQDAPISRVDLLISRNALMYFTPETQATILRHFNFALREHGFLFLGKSEMLITHADLFTPQSLKWRIFRPVPRTGLRDRMAFVSEVPVAAAPSAQDELQIAGTDVSPVAQILVDGDENLAAVNARARALLGLDASDVGRPLRDMEASYRPVELRSVLEDAYERRGAVRVGRVVYQPDDDHPQVVLDVTVQPVFGDGGHPAGASVTFEDITAYAALDEEHNHSKRQLETAYEELQSTVEELETTNEELHSTNEELETTNEELQSTNEELETMNEELHSTNDELEHLNTEQAQRTIEIDRINMFLEGILGNLGVGVVVVDREKLVQVWNASSEDLWGLRRDEVEGSEFFSLDLGLPTAELSGPLDAVMAGDSEGEDVRISAVTRRGRQMDCVVRVLPLDGDGGARYGAIMLMREGTEAEDPLKP